MADAVGLSALLGDADIVLTGEGSFDAQSLHGKVIDGVRARAPEVRPSSSPPAGWACRWRRSLRRG